MRLTRMLRLTGAGLLVPWTVLAAAPSAHAAEVECSQISAVDTVSEDTDAVSQVAEELQYDEMSESMGGIPGWNVGVAVIDSGVQGSYGTLPVSMNSPQDGEITDMHGTIVGGLIAGPAQDGKMRGIAPGANLYDVRAYDSATPSEGQDGIDTEAVLRGLQWVEENWKANNIKVAVVAQAVPPQDEDDPDSGELYDLVRRLSKDVVIVAASGNRPGEETSYLDEFAEPGPGQDAASMVFPAGYDEVLAVSATAPPGDDASKYVLPNSQTDVAAPTVGAISYGLNGRSCVVTDVATSWSTAIVGGLAAVVWRADQRLTAPQVVARIKSTATGAMDTPTMYTGAGVIQPMEALRRDLKITRDGTVREDGLARRPSTPLDVAPQPEDPREEQRADLVWWGLLAGGGLGLAAMARPLLLRRRTR